MRDRAIEGLPVESRRIEAAGISTRVLVGGEGAPLVLVHGSIQAGGLVWWRVIPDLAHRHHLVVPDIPGLGETEPEPDGSDPHRRVEWLAEVVEKTCAFPPVIVAHSGGGPIAIGLATSHPDLVRQLVLTGSLGLAPLRPRPTVVLAMIGAMARPGPRSFDRLMRVMMADASRPAEWAGWEDFRRSMLLKAGEPRVKKAMRGLARTSTKPFSAKTLRALRSRVDLIWGRDDPAVRLQVAETASREFGWPLVVVEAAGHLPHVERPEKFIDYLARIGSARR